MVRSNGVCVRPRRGAVRRIVACGVGLTGTALAAAPAAAAYSAAIEGTTLTVTGNAVSEELALRLQLGVATSLEIDVGNDGTADLTFDRGLFDQIVVNAGGGRDVVRIDGINGQFTDTEITTIDGEGGSDTLLGGNFAETLIGGTGRDLVQPGRGDDLVFLGSGNDTVAWIPGDGSDLVEGEKGDDLLVFNGSNASENIDIAANGQRVRFLRDVASITMDLDGVEQIDFAALGGADTVVVSGLAGTAAERVNVDLELVPGNGIGDAQADTILANGTLAPETFDIGAADGVLVVLGLGAELRVRGAELAADRLVVTGIGNDRVNVNGSKAADVMGIAPSPVVGAARVTVAGFAAPVDVTGAAVLAVNGLGGDDTISGANGLAATAIPLEIYGGKGNDALDGGDGGDLIFGEGGRDLVAGKRGDDVLFLGAGADTVVWDPGDGSDTLEGEGGNDVVAFHGSNATENIDLAANGVRLRFFRDVAAVTLDADGVEQADFRALGGADTVVVNDLSATAVRRVNVDLEGAPDSGIGDAQADTIVVNGTPLADKIRAAALASGVLVSRPRTSILIEHAEPAADTLVINGLGSVDKITADPDLTDLILLTLNPD